jgi:TM2 domain-containing membrane protein YozV
MLGEVGLGKGPTMSGQWNNDPTGRHQMRFWDGEAWTDSVSDNGIVGTDPLNILSPSLLSGAPQPPVMPPPAYGQVAYGQPTGGPESQKLAAGLCGILLGGFGVHKFILGYKTEGIIMLVIGLVGGLLTCGMATGVMGLIGLIEGIIYLTKSDAEFVQTYQIGKKTWF